MTEHPLIFCTLSSREFFPMVRLLEESLHTFHPNHKLVLFSNDSWSPPLPSLSPVFEIRPLSIKPRFTPLRMYYSKAKPKVIATLLAQESDHVIYLDPDMFVYSSLDEVISQTINHGLTLTPHILHPLEESTIPHYDKEILNVGIFNAGFVGVSKSRETLAFISWWKSRSNQRTMHPPGSSLEFDQRWLDLAPGFISNINILRDPGFNLAYFNAPSRNVEKIGEQYLVNGSRLKVIHYSGFRPQNLPSSNVYYPHINISTFGDLADLYTQYASELQRLKFSPKESNPHVEVWLGRLGKIIRKYF